MVSSVGDKKENKAGTTNMTAAEAEKAPAAAAAAAAAATPPVTMMTDAPSAAPKSARSKIKKKPSQMSVMDSSDRAAGTAVEVSTHEEEDAVPISCRSPGRSDSVIRLPNTSDVQKPPVNHYVAVTIRVEKMTDPGLQLFLNHVKLNNNLVVTRVKYPWMLSFLPGDQISCVNGTPVWNLLQLCDEYRKFKSVDKGIDVSLITVIRVWNYSCPTKQHLDAAGITMTAVDDRFQYFMVRLWHCYTAQGMSLSSAKKSVFVAELRSRTDASFGLINGDQLLMYGELVLTGKTGFKKKLADFREYVKKQRAAKAKFIDVFACRPIVARTTPNPSIEAELVTEHPERYKLKQPAEKPKSVMGPPPNPNAPPQTTNSTVGGTNPVAATGGAGTPPVASLHETEDHINPLLEADVLEIALREFSHLEMTTKPDQPLPVLFKGRSLLRTSSSAAPCSVRGSASNTNNTSVYMTSTYTQASTMGPPSAGTPRKSRWKKSGPARQNTVNFSAENQTAKITSDIAEEADLKKCDPRSGIVAYIRNAFNNG